VIDDTTPSRDHRPVPVVARELADVERYLADAPPHSGQGTRARLEARRAALQRELAQARRHRSG
jgi:hypothetical protein